LFSEAHRIKEGFESSLREEKKIGILFNKMPLYERQEEECVKAVNAKGEHFIIMNLRLRL
jgi:hypothetical protein